MGSVIKKILGYGNGIFKDFWKIVPKALRIQFMKEKVVLSSIILLHGYVHFVGFSIMTNKTVSTKTSTYMILN